MFIRMIEKFYKVWLRKIIRNSTENVDRVIIVLLRFKAIYVEKIRSIYKG